MDIITYKGLQLIGWFREVASDGPKEPILYRVTGLSSDDYCIVGYAGVGNDQKKKWSLHWYKSAKQVPTGDKLYDEPLDALKAVYELLNESSRADTVLQS